jgi:MSHA biogenesis protein MshQ
LFGLHRKCFVLLLLLAGMTCSGMLSAATSILNSSGGSNTSNGLKVYIDDSTQIQVQRLDSSGQLFDTVRTPPNNRLDNGIYLRSNGTIYGSDHFTYSTAGSYTGVSVSTVVPTTASQGVAQTTTSKFTVPYNSLITGPQVSIVWSYTYPFDFVTANVTITIPATYPISSSNPVRYYHVVDTYLGGSDCGCGVRYVDTNGKQVAGTYPWAGSCSSGSTSTGVSCPSSTTLPANLNVVESFRERNGSFSRYCVGNWQTFWSNSNTDACAIGKTNQLSSTVNTTLTDTGAAIEYDFTAAGVYTFSYDFVVGSTTVPDYDHLEIRHAGTSSLCPFEVKVLACLSSTVPCPDNQLVSSGDLYGDLLPASSSSLTKTPDRRFQLGSANTIDTFSYQSSTATTYTLGVSNLTKAPLNGVKCWNTATNSQSCSFVVTNVPCVNTFECMENTLTYNNRTTNSALRNPLYTKAMGANFDVDVVALLSSGAQSSGYNSTTGLTVQLVDASSGTCGATVVATKTVSFAASDSGRKKVTFNASDILRPHPNLRCKVTDVGLVKTGCSSDNFAIRPSSLAVTSVSPQQLSPSNTSTPTLKAGTDNFSVTVSTDELTYTGTPKVDSAKLDNHAGVTSVGQVAGNFSAAILGVSTGSTFTYSEVGHFRFQAEGIYDDTYAAVDISTGDCDNSFENNGVGTPKRFGCKFGNTAVSNYIGRFIPDRFEISPGSVTKACTTFVYFGQDSTTKPGVDVPFTISARNGAGAVTQYYTGSGASSYAKFDPSSWTNFKFTANPALVGATLSPSVFSPSLQGSWLNGQASMVAKFNVQRPASPVAEQTFAIKTQVQDSDGVATTPAQIELANTTYRYGRLAITPAHGSELLPLIVPVEAQYWSGSGYRRSTEDTCTTFPLDTIAMRNYRGNLNACETVLSVNSAMNKGIMSLRLSAPGVSGSTPNTGSVDLDLNFSAAGGDQTCTSAVPKNAVDGTAGMTSWFGPDPNARVTFGIYKAPIIYMRENFQ